MIAIERRGNMKFKIGDRVQIKGEGYFTDIINIDEEDPWLSYALRVYDIQDKVIAECSWHPECDLKLATPELVEQRAEENYKKFKEFEVKIIKAAEYAGITKEQAIKFMDGFNIE